MAAEPAPRCADCSLAMEEGWIPDSTYGAVLQNHWHPGKPEKTTFFGLETGGVKADRVSMFPIRSFRCPRCGLLRSYARPAPKKR